MDRQLMVRNAELFDSFLDGDPHQREFHRSVIKNGKKFVALVGQRRAIFVPGHYAVTSSSQLQQLRQEQTLPPAKVDHLLDTICGMPLSEREPFYDEVDAMYVDYCARSGDRPSEHHQSRTYWFMRPHRNC